jgi:5-methylcytosine-specific restriction endonuclease McrA
MATSPSLDRECSSCGNAFKGRYKKCHSCRNVDHVCACGAAFKGSRTKCNACRLTARECTSCGRAFRGANATCGPCGRTDRNCVVCGKEFRGSTQKCSGCRSTKRTCDCGNEFRGSRTKCHLCRWAALPKDVRVALALARNGRRRALKKSAQVAGPVPPSVYAAIRSEGPCVYCGASAEVVDHIVPLARGGAEHADNLVPACEACNSAKRARLLGEWDQARVQHGVRSSPKVAAAYAEQFHHEGVTDVD